MNAIEKMGFEGYFLLVHSYCNSVKRRGIARGSAGGSLVCYLSNITDIDPLEYGLYFERFIDVGALELLSEGKITQNELKANVNAKADAQKYETQVNSDAKKYQTEIDAQAKLEQQKREAEANAYMAEQEALAVKAKADAQKYEALQEAAGIEAKGKAEAKKTRMLLEAEAAGILAKGNAEAEAMQKKAEAYDSNTTTN
jgi:hypothetical protein